MVARILSIDPSTTEVGLFDGFMAATIVAPKKAPRPERLAYVMSELQRYMRAADDQYDFVVYEEQFVRGGAATKALFGVVGVIEAVAVLQGAGVMSVPQGKIRDWVAKELGLKKIAKGESKDAMEHVARSAFPHLFIDTEHEFDAACLYAYVRTKGIIS